MGKLKDMHTQLEEAVMDYAVDLNYEIMDFIDEKRHELESMAEDLAEQMATEHDLELGDLSDIGIEPVDIAADAWDCNIDY